MDVEISPEPSDEERQAILEALSAEETKPLSPWRRAALDPDGQQVSDPLGSDTLSPDPRRDSGVVQPRHPVVADRD